MKVWRKIMMGAWIAVLSALLANSMEAEAEITFTADGRMEGVKQGDSVAFGVVKEKNGTLFLPSVRAFRSKENIYSSDTDVDLSKIRTDKDEAYIYCSGQNYGVYKIEKDTKTKFRGKITGSTLTITEGTRVLDKTNWGDYQYRTEKGGWTDLKEGQDFSLTPYEQNGATLYFRYKGKPGKITATGGDLIDLHVEGHIEELPLWTVPADSFAGKEFKVKVPKKASAPAISVNYKTGVVKAKKGAEYQIGDLTSEWTDFNEDYVIGADDIYDLGSQMGWFWMRMKGTDTKASSKIACWRWEILLECQALRGVQTNTKAVESGKFLGDSLVYTSAKAKSIKDATFVIENKTNEPLYCIGNGPSTFEFYRTKTVDGKIVADGGPVFSVKPGKKIVLKNAMVPNNTELSIRTAGDKRYSAIPSPFSYDKVKIIYNVEDAAANK